jgi:hypothetical protein
MSLKLVILVSALALAVLVIGVSKIFNPFGSSWVFPSKTNRDRKAELLAVESVLPQDFPRFSSVNQWAILLGRDPIFYFSFALTTADWNNYIASRPRNAEGLSDIQVASLPAWARPHDSESRNYWTSGPYNELQFWVIDTLDSGVHIGGLRRKIVSNLPMEVYQLAD